MTLEARLATVVEAGRSKKAFRILVLDVHGLATFTDSFVFLSGGSDRQNRAIVDAIEEQLKAQGHRPISVEGDHIGSWILMDYGDFIVHVMDEDSRRHYNLEELWKAGATLELPPEPPSSHPSAPA